MFKRFSLATLALLATLAAVAPTVTHARDRYFDRHWNRHHDRWYYRHGINPYGGYYDRFGNWNQPD